MYKDVTEKSSQGCHHYGLLGSVHGLNTTSRVQAMDRAQESIVVAALARFLSHVLVQILLLVDLRDFFFSSRVEGMKKMNKKALKMTS